MPKVLVIDKNKDILNLLNEQLSIKGYEVNCASNGDEGISIAQQIKPDVILLNILNPDQDGFNTLKELKKNHHTSNIPVILDSIVEDYKEEGIKLGAVDFLSKPIDLNKLYSTIENVLNIEKLIKEKAVLIIDDDESIVEMTKDFLEAKDIKTFGASSGLEGLSIIHKEKIGLVILDLNMPNMDGYAVIKIIKDNPLTCDIPIVVVTSVDIKECGEKCLMLGADKCLPKTFNKSSLMDEIRSLMERTIRKERQSGEFKKARVLVADDEDIILELVSDTLEMAGYDLIVAHDGKEALEKIYSEHPDMVVLDVKMPYMTGFEVCQKIREDVLMANLPIIMLTAKTSENDEIKGLELGVDDYLTKPFRPAILLARVKAALSRIEQGLNVNPLTYLPGNTSIARDIERRLRAKEDFAVLYIDIDRFKAYNDYYGFHDGDELIKATARIVVEVVKRKGSASNFIGHIGGDDFICVIDEDKTQIICEEIIEEFDRVVLEYYNEEDRNKGYIVIENRKGVIEEFPLAALSIGVVSTKGKNFSHMGEISKLGAELKKFAKKNEKSNYVLDRRND